ncbi:MAG: 2-hydroxy-3-oxopropionate reductase [Bacteroidales bacterium 45-6]|nr:MAG: 2-hydroxy-3-oxopropionate reductase [Bacteroidales bacterium 45-6]
MEKVGFIGLGNMGHPMAKNLEKAGFPLAVYNRTAAKAKDFEEKSSVAGSIRDLVLQSDIVFTMLTNDASCKAVYDEIMTRDIQGKLFVDMSTISPELSISIANSIKAKEAGFLDAPVAGSTKPATEGTLTIMVGGDKADLQRALPYFEKLGKTTKHLGENGKGLAAKLCVNYFVSIIYQGLAESVLLSQKLGVNRKDILDIINESATGSGATKVKTPLLLENDFAPAFALDLMLKDILLAQKAGANFPLSQSLIESYQSAHDAGLGEQDVIGIINNIQSR